MTGCSPCWAQVLTLVSNFLAGECIEAVSHELTFFTLPNCFELFGFDLLVDEDWRVWLLEVSLAEPMTTSLCCSKALMPLAL